jgi:hypothetical protein
MKKSTHSKLKNTGILFELLTRQITADTMVGVSDSPALKIVKEFFGPKKTLAKELVLYHTLINESFKAPAKAEMLLATTIKLRKALNQRVLQESKYQLIKEVKKHYDLREFFKATVADYKLHAAIYRLFEGAGVTQVAELVKSRSTITEHIMRKRQTSPEVDTTQSYLKESEDVRLLAYRLMLEKFNDKYSVLSAGQRKILKEYINNISNTSELRTFIIQESKALKQLITKKADKVKDKVTAIKLAEVAHLLDRNQTIKRAREEHVHGLLLYHELLKEL